MFKLLALVGLFAAGVLLAGAAATVVSAQTTTTETVHHTTTQTVPTTSTVHETTTLHETTTVQQTTTAPATVVTTATVPPPTTAPTTTAPTSASGGTPTWVWVLLALLGAAVIGLLVYVLTRGGTGLPDTERRLRLQAAIGSWTAQGWALLSQSGDTAVLQRGNERMTVTVDPTGEVNARALTQPPGWRPPGQPTEQLPDQPTERLPEPPEEPTDKW